MVGAGSTIGACWMTEDRNQTFHTLHTGCCTQTTFLLLPYHTLAFVLLSALITARPHGCPSWPSTFQQAFNSQLNLNHSQLTAPSSHGPGQPSRPCFTPILFIESSTWINTVHFSWASRVLHSLHRTERLTVCPVARQSYEHLEEKNSLLSSSSSLPSVCNVAPHFCWVIVTYLLMLWSE